MVLLVLWSIACGSNQNPAQRKNNIIEREAFTIEYDYIPGFDVYLDVPSETIANVDTAFQKTGTMMILVRDDNHPLPFWKDDSLAGRFPDGDDFALRIYAKKHRNKLNGNQQNYHFLSVNSAWRNDFFGGWVTTLGKTIASKVYYQSHQPKKERYSFIFWGDIKRKQHFWNFSDEKLYAYAVEVTTHELGHQRANLGHFSQENGFHNPTKRNCVMQGIFDNIDSDYRIKPFFCDDQDADSTNSCADWLRSVNPRSKSTRKN